MASVNLVVIVGNVGNPPEVKFTPAGQAVANFTVACNDNWTDKAGVKQERVEWMRVVVWGKLAEVCGEHLHKGRQVYVEGKIQTREWTDKEGVKRQTTEIVAHNVQFLGSRDGAASGEHAPSQSSQPQRAASGGGPTTLPNYGRAKGHPIAGASDDDLEFYANGARRSIADPAKERFHAQERALLAAIEAEQARRRGDGSYGGPDEDSIAF